MRRLQYGVVLAGMIFGLFGGCGGSGSGDTKIAYTTVHYESNRSANRLNPDRGMYDADYVLNRRVDYDRFALAYQEGFRLVYASLDLETYVTEPTLPQELFAQVEYSLQEAQKSGVKLILRIVYRHSMAGEDPQKGVILAHLDQLAPLFARYLPVVSVVQAGLIGAWGEWHAFTGMFAASDPDHLTNRRELVEKLATIFPDKFIQIRTPMHKESLFGSYREYGDTTHDAQITESIAYSDDIRARIGHHNDYILGSRTDMGTYEEGHIDFWRAYVRQDALYAPLGGETGAIVDENLGSLTDCPSTLQEFRSMGYAFVNSAANEEVVAKWRKQGCYDTIAENIGYQLQMDRLEYAIDARKLHIKFSIHNRGYAAPYVHYPVSLIVHNGQEEKVNPLPIDLRRVKPGMAQEVTQEIDLSALPYGAYCLDLKIGDKPYTVHLANAMSWNSHYGSNQLVCGIDYKKE